MDTWAVVTKNVLNLIFFSKCWNFKPSTIDNNGYDVYAKINSTINMIHLFQYLFLSQTNKMVKGYLRNFNAITEGY